MFIFDFFRFVEKSIPLVVGVFFAIIGVIVAVRLPDSSNPVVAACLAGLLIYTSLMLICGFRLKKATRFWAISWFIALLLFLVVAAVFRS